MPSKRAKHPANQPIVNLLNEEIDSVHSENLKQTYRRAVRHILLTDFPITSKQDALQIRCVGEYIATKIDIFLRNARESNAKAAAAALARQQASLQNTDPSPTPHAQSSPPAGPSQPEAHAAPDSRDQTPSAAKVIARRDDMSATERDQGGAATARRRAQVNRRASSSGRGGTQAPGGRRGYTPKFRSGNFAFLLALLDALDEGVHELSRVQLQSRAEKYCDEPVVKAKTSDPSTFYNAWSGMSTLTKKGLVAKHGSPAWYLLTTTGVECARVCRQMDLDVRIRSTCTSSPTARAPEGDVDEDQEYEGNASPSQKFGTGAVTGPGKKLVRASQDATKTATLSRPPNILAGIHSEEFESVQVKPAHLIHGATQVTAGALHQSRGTIYDDEVYRAVIASERCEADGYGREECLDVLREIFDADELPRTIDALHVRMHDRLWERKQATFQGRSQELSTARPLGRIPQPDLNAQLRPNVTIALSTVKPNNSRITEGAAEPLDIGAKSYPHSIFEELRPGHVPGEAAYQAVSPLHRNEISGDRQSSGSLHSVPAIPKVDSVIDLCEDTSDRSPSPLSRKRSRLTTSEDPSASQDDFVKSGKKKPHNVSHLSTEVLDVADDVVVEVGESTPAPAVKTADSKSNNAEDITQCSNRPDATTRLPRSSQSTIVSYEHQMEFRIILLLDTMERLQRNTLSAGDANTIANMLLENGVKCEVRPLPCGDAMFIAQFIDGTEVVLDYLIERKTIDDFTASMHDGRVAKQSYMMSQSQIERRMFVLEGDINSNPEMLRNPEFLKKLAQLEVCDDFYVKRTKNLKETIWFYSSMYSRLCKNFQGYPKSALLEGRIIFSEWSERMKLLKSGLTLDQLFALQLCQIRGISAVTALAILKKGYNTPQALYRAFKSELDPERRETVLADGEQGISTRTSRLLCKLFTAKDYGTEILEEA